MSASSSHLQDELTEVVTHVQRALRPVALPPGFREHLRDGLRVAAEHQQAHHAMGFEPERRGGAWGWVFGAAVIGAVIGFLAIHFRAHRRRITV
jgi:hypothetical protein